MTLRPPRTLDVTQLASPSIMLALLGRTETTRPAAVATLRKRCARTSDDNHILCRAAPGQNEASITTIYCVACIQFGNIPTVHLTDEHIFPCQQD